MATKRAAIYTRVSTDEQTAQGFSLPTQEGSCRAYCQEHGWQVVAVFREDYTGMALDRPELDRLRDMASTGQMDAVVCHDLDRLSRKAVHYLILKEELEGRRGIEVHFVQTGHAETDEDHCMEIARAGIAEYEHARISERNLRGSRGKVGAGSTLVRGAGPPFGYGLERQGNGLYRLIIDEEEARVVRMIYEWYAQGDGASGPLSGYAIADRLSEMGILTKGDKRQAGRHKRLNNKRQPAGTWTPGVVMQLLANETYAGTWYYGKKGRDKAGRQMMQPRDTWIPVPCPAIIDRATWDAAQKRRLANKMVARRNTRYPFLLAKRVVCGACGYKMAGMPIHDGEALYLYYHCVVKGVHGRHPVQCNSRYFRADYVDAVVWVWLKGLLADAVNLDRTLCLQQAKREEQLQPLRDRLAIVEDLLTDNRRQLEELLEVYLLENLQFMLIERRVRLETTITQLEAERNTLVAPLAEQESAIAQIDSLEKLAAQVGEGTEAADEDFSLKRQFVELLDVTARLCVEAGVKVVYVTCAIAKERLPLLQPAENCGNS